MARLGDTAALLSVCDKVSHRVSVKQVLNERIEKNVQPKGFSILFSYLLFIVTFKLDKELSSLFLLIFKAIKKL